MLAGGADGQLGFAAASDGRVDEMEVVQDRLEAGPCVEAYETGRLGRVDDLQGSVAGPSTRSAPWSWVSARSSRCRCRPGVAPSGSSTSTASSPAPWDPSDVEAAEILTAMGAAYVLHADQSRAQHELTDQLQQALESRDVIGQAKGLLMTRHAVTADVAFEMLRRASQDTNVKLRELAKKLVVSG
jgi:hypothetical protein